MTPQFGIRAHPFMNALVNAFSLNMVAGTAMLQVREVPATEVPADAQSAVGHESTAQVLSILLGREVPACRKAITLSKGDTAYVATLFTRAGAPFRPPEGVVMTDVDLREVDIRFRAVTVVS